MVTLKDNILWGIAMIRQIIPALVVALGGMCVTYIGEISKNLQAISISVQELNLRMGQVSGIVSDHEARLRHVEKNHGNDNNKPWR